jgi:adenylate cyclase
MLTMLKSFAKYVPKNVVDQLVHDNSEAQLGLTPSMCTIFFLDIKDFTKLSEELEPSKLVQLMSDAFEVLSAQVHSVSSFFLSLNNLKEWRYN